MLFLLLKNGMIRKNKLIDVAKSGTRELRESGKLIYKIKANDELVSVKLASELDDIFICHQMVNV